ncbi:TPA: hypothetical protein N0F65_002684 [Lagenidium giganteum]|uniref:RBR-type E3 ubiquitin transferase n=1 Tax=Lagenidium giganteum TaxID=4803 RepID=A0AAV2Z4S9_9STRA|nr:TPA: hypothetical protein N0F65_002684 [Lagenidium giganteum]
MKRSESDGDLARTSVSSASSYVLVATPREALDATETVFCQVCLDHASAHDAFVLTRCGHGFCCACITQYVTVQINDGRVDPVCFSENRTDGGEAHVCGQAIADEDVQSLVSAATWEKVERFRLFQSNPNARVCPQCDHVQVFERGHKKLQCVCATCATTFCFVHNDAHLGQKCAKYVKAMAAAESHAQAVIRNTTKPCPGCRNPIEKNGGCNHMTCSRCQTEFCWVCGVMVPRSEPHWDIGGCPRMPLLSVDGLEVEANQWHNTTATQRVRYVVLFILRLPIYVVACVLALVLWVKQPFASNFDRFARTGTAWCILAIDWVVGTIKEVMSILTIACIYSVGCTLCVAVSPFFGWKQFWIELKASTVGVHEWARGLVIDPVQKTCFCCHADIVKTGE